MWNRGGMLLVRGWGEEREGLTQRRRDAEMS